MEMMLELLHVIQNQLESFGKMPTLLGGRESHAIYYKLLSSWEWSLVASFLSPS